MSADEVLRLTVPIAEARRTEETPRYGMARDGYTLRSGAPTSLVVRLQGEKRWRRLMCWQFSNVGTCFLRIKGENLVVSDHMVPEVGPRCPSCNGLGTTQGALNGYARYCVACSMGFD